MLPSLAEILRPPHDVLTDLERTYLERARTDNEPAETGRRGPTSPPLSWP